MRIYFIAYLMIPPNVPVNKIIRIAQVLAALATPFLKRPGFQVTEQRWADCTSPHGTPPPVLGADGIPLTQEAHSTHCLHTPRPLTFLKIEFVYYYYLFVQYVCLSLCVCMCSFRGVHIVVLQHVYGSQENFGSQFSFSLLWVHEMKQLTGGIHLLNLSRCCWSPALFLF